MSCSGLTTVVIPVYNGAKYLAEAVESVRHQTSGSSEIIIVDDDYTIIAVIAV